MILLWCPRTQQLNRTGRLNVAYKRGHQKVIAYSWSCSFFKDFFLTGFSFSSEAPNRLFLLLDFYYITLWGVYNSHLALRWIYSRWSRVKWSDKPPSCAGSRQGYEVLDVPWALVSEACLLCGRFSTCEPGAHCGRYADWRAGSSELTVNTPQLKPFPQLAASVPWKCVWDTWCFLLLCPVCSLICSLLLKWIPLV